MTSKQAERVLNPTPPHTVLSLSDLCEDVILMICDHLEHMRAEKETPLKHFSLVNRQFRSLLIPRLFKTLHINQPISQLTPTPLIEHHAQTFKIDMFGSMWWWCSGSYTSSSDALDLFSCIQELRSIKSLEISMMRRSIDIFTTAFEDSGIQDFGRFVLDKVEKLTVTSSAAFLKSHCPNLKSLVIQDESDCLVETYIHLSRRLAPLHPRLDFGTRGNERLTTFDATAVWSADEVDALVALFPKLKCLRMRSDKYCYRASVATIFNILGKGLAELKALHLVKCGRLNMGYLSGWKRRIPEYSNADYRRMLWLEVEGLRVRAENDIAREAFGSIESLTYVWLGENRIARRCDDDEGGLRWIWERKKEDADESEMDGYMFARFRTEREAVVVGSEIGM